MDEQTLLINFGLNFKKERIKLKLTQEDIINRTNFSKSYVSNVENGKYNISVINALKFSKIVNKTIEELVSD